MYSIVIEWAENSSGLEAKKKKKKPPSSGSIVFYFLFILFLKKIVNNINIRQVLKYMQGKINKRQ